MTIRENQTELMMPSTFKKLNSLMISNNGVRIIEETYTKSNGYYRK